MNQITRDHDWWVRKKCLAAGRLVVGGSYLRGCVVRVPRGWRGTDCDGALRGQIDREVKARFPARAVRQVALLQLGDDPVIEPGHLLARVFVEAAGGLQDYQRSLDGVGASTHGGDEAAAPRAFDEASPGQAAGVHHRRHQRPPYHCPDHDAR